MRVSGFAHVAHSRHLTFAKATYEKSPFHHLLRHKLISMPKRKLSQVTADATRAISITEKAPILTIPVSQNSQKAKLDGNINAKLTLSKKSIAERTVVSDTLNDSLSNSDSPLSEPPEDESDDRRSAKPNRSKHAKKKISANGSLGRVKAGLTQSNGTAPSGNLPSEDAESDIDDEEIDEAKIQEASLRPPPVNSSYLPIPWKGRLGYACLNTYLRTSNPPVFSSRTCRIASIIEHRHPLKDPSQPEHATKNRPNRDMPADIKRGQEYVEALGIANAKDITKMVRWNDKYGIKFMRLSSEIFPFASHDIYGYKLAPFAADVLEEAGKVIAQLGHRFTTHPGQFTQLGSPRKQVIDAAIRDLNYHDEMLSLLKLPPQQNRDAVMILHMGGVFGSKPDTLARFREVYTTLSQSIKNRLVLENDDVSWTVHDLLPVCQELNIPMVLDYHHHNILFDTDKIREGTEDITQLYEAITETWRRKNITQKMHYSESTPAAITSRQRRKHSPRVATLPPCADTMDLMIEAKDKEQAVFELMRTFKLPGHDLFNNIIPHVRADENKVLRKTNKAISKKKSKNADANEPMEDGNEILTTVPIPDEKVGMGGDDRRVYWPPGMEEWLRPKKRVSKIKDEQITTPAKPKTRKPVLEATENGVEKATAIEPKMLSHKVKATKKKKGKVATTSLISNEGEANGIVDTNFDDDHKQPLADMVTGNRKSEGQRKNSRRSSVKVSYTEEDSN